MAHAGAKELNISSGVVPITKREVPDVGVQALRSEGAGTDSSVTRCFIFVLLMTFIKNTGMSCVNFINVSIFNVLKSNINDELEVSDCHWTSINVMLGRDAPMVTYRGLETVEQFFSFRETERRNLLTLFADFKNELVIKYQPSGAGGTRSPPAKFKMAPWGAPKWPAGVGKISILRFLGAPGERK